MESSHKYRCDVCQEVFKIAAEFRAHLMKCKQLSRATGGSERKITAASVSRKSHPLKKNKAVLSVIRRPSMPKVRLKPVVSVSPGSNAVEPLKRSPGRKRQSRGSISPENPYKRIYFNKPNKEEVIKPDLIRSSTTKPTETQRNNVNENPFKMQYLEKSKFREVKLQSNGFSETGRSVVVVKQENNKNPVICFEKSKFREMPTLVKQTKGDIAETTNSINLIKPENLSKEISSTSTLEKSRYREMPKLIQHSSFTKPTNGIVDIKSEILTNKKPFDVSSPSSLGEPKFREVEKRNFSTQVDPNKSTDDSELPTNTKAANQNPYKRNKPKNEMLGKAVSDLSSSTVKVQEADDAKISNRNIELENPYKPTYLKKPVHKKTISLTSTNKVNQASNVTEVVKTCTVSTNNITTNGNGNPCKNTVNKKVKTEEVWNPNAFKLSNYNVLLSSTSKIARNGTVIVEDPCKRVYFEKHVQIEQPTLIHETKNIEENTVIKKNDVHENPHGKVFQAVKTEKIDGLNPTRLEDVNGINSGPINSSSTAVKSGGSKVVRSTLTQEINSVTQTVKSTWKIIDKTSNKINSEGTLKTRRNSNSNPLKPSSFIATVNGSSKVARNGTIVVEDQHKNIYFDKSSRKKVEVKQPTSIGETKSITQNSVIKNNTVNENPYKKVFKRTVKTEKIDDPSATSLSNGISSGPKCFPSSTPLKTVGLKVVRSTSIQEISKVPQTIESTSKIIKINSCETLQMRRIGNFNPIKPSGYIATVNDRTKISRNRTNVVEDPYKRVYFNKPVRQKVLQPTLAPETHDIENTTEAFNKSAASEHAEVSDSSKIYSNRSIVIEDPYKRVYLDKSVRHKSKQLTLIPEKTNNPADTAKVSNRSAVNRDLFSKYNSVTLKTKKIDNCNSDEHFNVISGVNNPSISNDRSISIEDPHKCISVDIPVYQEGRQSSLLPEEINIVDKSVVKKTTINENPYKKVFKAVRGEKNYDVKSTSLSNGFEGISSGSKISLNGAAVKTITSKVARHTSIQEINNVTQSTEYTSNSFDNKPPHKINACGINFQVSKNTTAGHDKDKKIFTGTVKLKKISPRSVFNKSAINENPYKKIYGGTPKTRKIDNPTAIKLSNSLVEVNDDSNVYVNKNVVDENAHLVSNMENPKLLNVLQSTSIKKAKYLTKTTRKSKVPSKRSTTDENPYKKIYYGTHKAGHGIEKSNVTKTKKPVPCIDAEVIDQLTVCNTPKSVVSKNQRIYLGKSVQIKIEKSDFSDTNNADNSELSAYKSIVEENPYKRNYFTNKKQEFEKSTTAKQWKDTSEIIHSSAIRKSRGNENSKNPSSQMYRLKQKNSKTEQLDRIKTSSKIIKKRKNSRIRTRKIETGENPYKPISFEKPKLLEAVETHPIQTSREVGEGETTYSSKDDHKNSDYYENPYEQIYFEKLTTVKPNRRTSNCAKTSNCSIEISSDSKSAALQNPYKRIYFNKSPVRYIGNVSLVKGSGRVIEASTMTSLKKRGFQNPYKRKHLNKPKVRKIEKSTVIRSPMKISERTNKPSPSKSGIENPYKRIYFDNLKKVKVEEADEEPNPSGNSKSMDNSRSFNCLLCDYSSPYTWCVRLHMERTHNVSNPKIHKCKFCGEHLGNLHQLKKHQGAGFCVRTNKIFAKQRKEKERGNKSLYNCSQCDYQSHYTHCIRSHMKRLHKLSNVEFLRCKVCNDVYTDMVQLQKHGCLKESLCDSKYSKKVNPSNCSSVGPVYICDVCDDIFDTKINFYTHKTLIKCSKRQTLNKRKEIFGKSIESPTLKILRISKEILTDLGCTLTCGISKENRILKTRNGFTTSTKEEIGKEIHTCFLCDETFQTEDDYDIHWAQRHPESPDVHDIDVEESVDKDGIMIQQNKINAGDQGVKHLHLEMLTANPNNILHQFLDVQPSPVLTTGSADLTRDFLHLAGRINRVSSVPHSEDQSSDPENGGDVKTFYEMASVPTSVLSNYPPDEVIRPLSENDVIHLNETRLGSDPTKTSHFVSGMTQSDGGPLHTPSNSNASDIFVVDDFTWHPINAIVNPVCLTADDATWSA